MKHDCAQGGTIAWISSLSVYDPDSSVCVVVDEISKGAALLLRTSVNINARDLARKMPIFPIICWIVTPARSDDAV
jgi:hypothetical protein